MNVAFNDAAANTVNVPAAAGAADAALDDGALDDAEPAGFELDGAADELDAAEVAAALVVDDDVLDDAAVVLELQPTTRVATHSPARVATTARQRGERGRLTRILQEFR